MSLLFPSMSGFSEVAPGVWAERGMSASARVRLIETVETADGTARHQVARSYARAGRTGLDRLFSALRAGETFERAYASTEATTP